MSILNDANGYIYAAVSNFLMTNSANMLNNGVAMTIKCLTGDKNYKGSVVTLRNVMFETLNGLTFDYSANDISKFDLSFSYLDFTFTPGGLKEPAGVVGAIASLI